MYRFCHRCQAELPPHDEGSLFFCSHCGAAQIELSEELQSQVESQARAVEDGGAQTIALDRYSLVWPGAIRAATLAGAVAATFSCLSILLPPVALLTFLWAIISPVVVLGWFQTRHPVTPVNASFGARLGLLTGLAIALGLSIVDSIKLVIARFGIHAMGEVDKQVAASLDQIRTQAVAQSGAQVLPFFDVLNIPEFRAGFLLLGVALMMLMLLAITTAGGAFAGFARSRSKV